MVRGTIREAGRRHALDNISDVDETGLFCEVLPRRTYTVGFEGPKPLEARVGFGPYCPNPRGTKCQATQRSLVDNAR